jgi:hypothetical protein
VLLFIPELLASRPLLHCDRQAVEVGADDRADRVAGERQHRAVPIGEHDCLRAAADGRADIARGIDAGDVPRAVDVAHGAAKARLRRAEGEAIADAADPERVALAVEGERARARRAADHQARLDDAEADAALVGLGGGREGSAGQGQHGDQAGTKGGGSAHAYLLLKSCSRRGRGIREVPKTGRITRVIKPTMPRVSPTLNPG